MHFMRPLALSLATSAALCATFAIPMTASAHAVWLAERAGKQALVNGHGAEDDNYPLERLRSATAYLPDGKTAAVTHTAALMNDKGRGQAFYDLPGDAQAVLTHFVSGLWAKGADGKWSQKTRAELPDAQKIGIYAKWNLAILSPSFDAARWQAPEGTRLVLVPLKNPLTLKAGAVLPVKVLLDGKPLANVALQEDAVNLSHVKRIRTDAKGVARIPIRNQGLNVIALEHDVPHTQKSEADVQSFLSTLSFTLAPLDPE